MPKMSKEMPIEVFAKKVGINKKEQDWIVKNDKEAHYYNNTPLKGWLALGYPVYDGDYYFAFIHKNPRVNAQYNAKANRELRKYIKSSLSADQIFDEMEKYFAMQFKNAGSGDTMTREELWSAIVDARKKNPVREEVEESKKMTSAQKREFDKLYKKMDGGKEHQAIKQKIKNPVKADDAFHSLVMKKVLGEGKGSDLFKKYSSVINRLSDKEKDEVIELLYTMNTQSGRRYKEAFGKVKELLNMEYIPEETNILDSYRQMWEQGQKYAPESEEETVSEGKQFKDKDIEIVAKFTDRNEHTLSLMHVAKVLGDRKAGKKLELIYKMHNEYGHMPSGLKSLRDEIFDDFKKQFKKYDNGDQMYGAL